MLGVILFTMGLTLQREDFRRVLRRQTVGSRLQRIERGFPLLSMLRIIFEPGSTAAQPF